MAESDLGILGGGQLARMLLAAATAFGLDVTIMEPAPDSPAGLSGAGSMMVTSRPNAVAAASNMRASCPPPRMPRSDSAINLMVHCSRARYPDAPGRPCPSRRRGHLHGRHIGPLRRGRAAHRSCLLHAG